MKTSTTLIIFAIAGIFVGASAEDPSSGRLAIYGAQYEGRPTASGEIYNSKELTAAHSTMPFGTIVRVANFSTGKMADLRVNDRKAEDNSTFTVSQGAAKKLGLANAAPASVTYQVVGRVAPKTTMQASPDGEWYSGLHRIGLFGNGNSNSAPKSNGVPPSSYPVNPYYGKGQKSGSAQAPPATQAEATGYAPAPEKKSGFSLAGLFGGNNTPSTSVPSASYPTYNTNPAPAAQTYPAPNYSANGDLVPLNAVAPASTPAPEVSAQPQPMMSALPGQPAAAPYRAQFGAFRRSSNAYEMAKGLHQSGIGNMVVQSPSTNLFLVVTSMSFHSAGDAQHWIDNEAARRGWQERPVVIR